MPITSSYPLEVICIDFLSLERSKGGYEDEKARSSVLVPGDRVLVRNVSIRGKQKLADRWEQVPYIVIRQPDEDNPVFEVKREGARYKKSRTLHRNMLLPFMSTTDVLAENDDPVEDSHEDSSPETEADGDSGDEQRDQESARPYVIPMLRPPGAPGLSPPSRPRQQENTQRDMASTIQGPRRQRKPPDEVGIPHARPRRNRKAPDRLQYV